MNAHISDKDPMNVIQRVFRENVKKVELAGIMAGAKAICNLILEMAQNSDKTADEKLDDIIKLCRTNTENKNT